MRASLVAKAERWEWSSAAAHCGMLQPDGCLAMELWQARWSACSWRTFLSTGVDVDARKLHDLRAATAEDAGHGFWLGMCRTLSMGVTPSPPESLKWCGKPMRLQPSKRSILSQGLHHSFHFLAQCGVVFRECDAELFVRRHLEGDR